MTSRTSLESEITQWLVELIESDKLLGTIASQESIGAALEAIDSRVGVPAFGFDHLSRRANIRAASTVLENLGLLEIVAVDKSISLTKGEVLRPDILCFNPETRTLVVFEVKRDKLTERQAITELAGYEQELRNALSLLGDFDVNFVVVAAHWDVLLSHAVGNFNTWSGKHCLALTVAADARPFFLACHLPDVWQLRGSCGLPDEALQTIDVYLYAEKSGDGMEIPNELITAINIIARAGDRHDSHGFAMLWMDYANSARGRWCLTLCGIDPIAMHAWCKTNGLVTRASQLGDYLDEHARRVPFQPPNSLYRIAKESFRVLRGKFDPSFESATSWGKKLGMLRRRAFPLHFEFWGALGDYARDFVSHGDVRTRYMSFIDHFGLDWTHPKVAVPLIGNICDDIPFSDGTVRCNDAFEAGVRLGLHEMLCHIAGESEDEERKLTPLIEWSLLEALRTAIEMTEIYRTVEEIAEPPPPLSNRRELRKKSSTELCQWVDSHLIGPDHPAHRRCFELGRIGAAYFSDWLEDSEREVFIGAKAESLAASLRELVLVVLDKLQSATMDPKRFRALSAFLNTVGIDSGDDATAKSSKLGTVPALNLLRAFRDDRAKGLDEVIPAVLHTVHGIPPLSIDWDGVKDSVKKVFDSGCSWPAIILSQNGAYGVGMVDGLVAKMLIPIDDPGCEVYFMDQRSAANMWVKMTWPELQDLLTRAQIAGGSCAEGA